MTPTSFKHHPVRSTILTADDARREYALLAARAAEAEHSSTPDEWIELMLDWNSMTAYVRGEGARISYHYSGAMNDPDREEADRIQREEVGPVVADGESLLVQALLASAHRDAIAARFGAYLLRRYELAVASLDPVNRDLRVEAGRLAQRYSRRTAEAQVSINGQMMTLAMAASHGLSEDRTVRRDAFMAVRNWFVDERGEFSGIYSDLVRLRTEMARNVGFQNFVPLGYQAMGRTDFGPEESALFRASVKENVVPVMRRLLEHQRDALGLDRLEPWDVAFDPSVTLPRGVAPIDSQLDNAAKIFAQLDPLLASHFARMRREDLIDLENRVGKRSGAFCTRFPDEPRAAILCNSVGDSDDVRTLLHEMGHAFQSWESMPIDMVMLQSPTSEIAEIHSMGMEYLSLPLIHTFFPQEAMAARFRGGRWKKAITLLCYASVVDEFQHWVYDYPDATPGDRDDAWCRIWDEYQPVVDFGGRDDLKSARWYQQQHIFQAPFYYIDYAIAETVAMQLAALDRQDHEKAMATYLTLCRIGGTRSILDVVKVAGLHSPFDPDVMADLMVIAEEAAG